MQRLEVSGAVRPIYGSLGVKRLKNVNEQRFDERCPKSDCRLFSLFLIFTRVREIAKSDYYLSHVCLSVWNNSVLTGRIFFKFDIYWYF